MYLFLRNLLPLLILLLSPNFIYAHGSVGGYASGPDRSISFPDTKEYLTISSDLHTHSVFSDGHVWPNIRVSEAEKDTIDVLAITEHLEYQPHTNFIPNEDRNAAYLEAKKASEGTDLIVISGSEITREMPPGHMNAVFIEDANKLFNMNKDRLPEAKGLIDERAKEMNLSEEEMVVIEKYALGNLWPAIDALLEAKKQGAFVFWNHPMWGSQAPDGVARLSDMHKDFISKDLMHGIEVVNTDTYSEEAFQIALDNNLALIGTSDVHNLIEWDYDVYKNEHRPVTLIFAKKRTEKSIREALFDRRTVVVYKDRLMGRNDDLMPLLESILIAKSDGYRRGTKILKVELSNNSSSDMSLKNLSEVNFSDSDDFIVVPKKGSVILNVKTLEKLESLNLKFEVLNALTAPKKSPVIEFEIGI
tara:strand:+ start:2263 stop:3516 length:1254 start_codon:yes stop_codon:yes gene_type:complete